MRENFEEGAPGMAIAVIVAGAAISTAFYLLIFGLFLGKTYWRTKNTKKDIETPETVEKVVKDDQSIYEDHTYHAAREDQEALNEYYKTGRFRDYSYETYESRDFVNAKLLHSQTNFNEEDTTAHHAEELVDSASLQSSGDENTQDPLTPTELQIEMLRAIELEHRLSQPLADDSS